MSCGAERLCFGCSWWTLFTDPRPFRGAACWSNETGYIQIRRKRISLCQKRTMATCFLLSQIRWPSFLQCKSLWFLFHPQTTQITSRGQLCSVYIPHAIKKHDDSICLTFPCGHLRQITLMHLQRALCTINIPEASIAVYQH